MAALTFLVGLIVGAILGVFADRVWSRVEKRVRVGITYGEFKDIRYGEGIEFTIKNMGFKNIPPYRIALFHPDKGSLFIFQRESSEPLLPGQQDEHRCTLSRKDVSQDFIKSWFVQQDRESERQQEIQEYRLRLVMDKSARILWESHAMGSALARLFAKAYLTSSTTPATWEEAMALTYPPPRRSSRLKRVLFFWR